MAELRGVLRPPFLERVDGKRAQRRAAAGEHPEDGAERRPAQHRRPGAPEILVRRPQPRDLLCRQRARFPRLRQVGDDLANPEYPDGERGDVNPVGQFRNAEREARPAGVAVGADETDQEAKHDHGDRLDHRAMGEHHRGDEAKYHQREIFRRSERLAHFCERRRKGGDQRCRDAAGEKRAERRHRQGSAGATLSRHLVAIGPMPGRTPINVPISAPTSAKTRFAGVSATPKPTARLCRSSIYHSGHTGMVSPSPRMKMPQERMISTSAAASVSSGRKPRAATAPTPISSKIETTSPSRSMLSPKITRLAVTKMTGRNAEMSPDDSGRASWASRSPCTRTMTPRPSRSQHNRRGT